MTSSDNIVFGEDGGAKDKSGDKAEGAAEAQDTANQRTVFGMQAGRQIQGGPIFPNWGLGAPPRPQNPQTGYPGAGGRNPGFQPFGAYFQNYPGFPPHSMPHGEPQDALHAARAQSYYQGRRDREGMRPAADGWAQLFAPQPDWQFYPRQGQPQPQQGRPAQRQDPAPYQWDQGRPAGQNGQPPNSGQSPQSGQTAPAGRPVQRYGHSPQQAALESRISAGSRRNMGRRAQFARQPAQSFRPDQAQARQQGAAPSMQPQPFSQPFPPAPNISGPVARPAPAGPAFSAAPGQPAERRRDITGAQPSGLSRQDACAGGQATGSPLNWQIPPQYPAQNANSFSANRQPASQRPLSQQAPVQFWTQQNWTPQTPDQSAAVRQPAQQIPNQQGYAQHPAQNAGLYSASQQPAGLQPLNQQPLNQQIPIQYWTPQTPNYSAAAQQPAQQVQNPQAPNPQAGLQRFDGQNQVTEYFDDKHSAAESAPGERSANGRHADGNAAGAPPAVTPCVDSSFTESQGPAPRRETGIPEQHGAPSFGDGTPEPPPGPSPRREVELLERLLQDDSNAGVYYKRMAESFGRPALSGMLTELSENCAGRIKALQGVYKDSAGKEFEFTGKEIYSPKRLSEGLALAITEEGGSVRRLCDLYEGATDESTARIYNAQIMRRLNDLNSLNMMLNVR